MKNLRRVFALLLSLVAVVSLAACGGGENTAPQITGVADQMIEAGSAMARYTTIAEICGY